MQACQPAWHYANRLKPGVGQDQGGVEPGPQCALEHLPEQAVFGVLARPAQVAGRGAALVLEGFVLGLFDAALF
ncbi:MAG: hypothetical protein GYA76_07595, partial [Verrucomicrobia bacterium]|nr:hypothetical protein [Verrucomicrobiota bacterium]